MGFFKTHFPAETHEIWVSDPTWGNHISIFEKAGLEVKKYPYWDGSTRSLNFDGMVSALSGAKTGSLVLLHACAHNPTGIDPTEDQWKKLLEIVKEKKLVPLMDSAYQGYASGDLDKDAWSMRLFEREGVEMFVCQSFAKNLGLYGERMGMVHVVCGSQEAAKCVLSQVKLVVRPMYSSPPIHGAHLVIKILGEPERFQKWMKELKDMSSRILEVRSLLRTGLEGKGTPGTWNHITDQIGMFSFTGLDSKVCERLIETHHIYLLKSGRISMAGLNRGNMEYFVTSVDEAVRACA